MTGDTAGSTKGGFYWVGGAMRSVHEIGSKSDRSKPFRLLVNSRGHDSWLAPGAISPHTRSDHETPVPWSTNTTTGMAK